MCLFVSVLVLLRSMVGTVFVVDVCFVPAVMFSMVVSADCVGVQYVCTCDT